MNSIRAPPATVDAADSKPRRSVAGGGESDPKITRTIGALGLTGSDEGSGTDWKFGTGSGSSEPVRVKRTPFPSTVSPTLRFSPTTRAAGVVLLLGKGEGVAALFGEAIPGGADDA